MAGILVAIANEKLQNSIRTILEHSSIEVRGYCRSGDEVIRNIKLMGGGIVIAQSRMPDMQTIELVEELGDLAYFLILDRQYNLYEFSDCDVFTLPVPIRGGELSGSLRILMQMDERRSLNRTVKVRSEGDQKLITDAKEMIMEKSDMTEEQAYRFLQKRSMETSTPMTEVAKMILNAFTVG